MQYIETNQNNVLMFTTNRAAQNNTAAHKRCADNTIQRFEPETI